MRTILYTSILFCLCFCNALLAQIDLESGYYQTNAIDFNFRTDQPNWLPEQQIMGIIEVLMVEEVSAANVQIRVLVSVQDTTQGFDENIQQLIGQLLQKKGLQTQQIIYTPTKVLADDLIDPNKAGYYAMVEVSQWMMIEEEQDEIIVANKKTVAKDNVIEDNTVLNNFLVQQQEPPQIFTMKGNQAQLITAAKGTILSIPPNSFVNDEGVRVEDSILLTVKEVYEVKDMMTEQVQTTSGNQLIETGGMIYLAANTMEGEQLQLAADRTITAVMASDEAQLPNMQTFEGVTNAQGRIDWRATANQVLTNSSNNFTQKVNAKYKPSTLDVALQVDYSDIAFLPDLPAEQNLPTWNRTKPESPNLVPPKKYTRDEVEALFMIGKNENRDSYNKRVINKLNQLNKAYYKQQNENKVIESQYRSAMIAYKNAKNLHDIELRRYHKYARQMSNLLTNLHAATNSFELATYHQELHQLAMAFSGLRAKVNYMNQKLNLMVSYGREVVQDYPIMDSFALQSMNQITAINQLTQLALPDINNIFDRYKNGNGFRDEDELKGWNALVKEINNLKAQVDKDTSTVLTVEQLNQIRRLHYQTKHNYHYNRKQHILQYFYKAIERNRSNIQLFLEVENSFQVLNESFEKTKQELGLLTTEEIVRQYGSALQINRMGWINCDRFLQNNSNNVDCEIMVEQGANTQFYMVFKNMNAMMMATRQRSMSATATNHFVFNNIPATEVVKLIGVQIQEGKMSRYFVKEGVASDFKSIKPLFIETSTEEILDRVVAQ